MINKEKLKEIMQFLEKENPSGYMLNYIDIIKDKREIEDCEIDNILDDCLNQFIYEDLKMGDNLNPYETSNPEDIIEIIRLILTAQNQEEYKDRKLLLNNICNLDIENNKNYNGLIQFILYILNEHKFLEYRFSISGAWLTEKGKLFLELLNMYYE